MGPPGHFAVGLAAKSVTPKVPLWVLLVANEALDLLSFGFLAAGLEELGVSQTDFVQGVKMISPGSIPWSHGLFMSVIWSLLTALVVYLISRDRRVSAVLGLVVFSHWVLDFIVHPADLPLLFGSSTRVGLGMWTSGVGLITSIVLEFALLVGGIAIYKVNRKRKTTVTPISE
jgi:membrane-bound metal-dependent hydrolase YbcI (DUF457 family)